MLLACIFKTLPIFMHIRKFKVGRGIPSLTHTLPFPPYLLPFPMYLLHVAHLPFSLLPSPISLPPMSPPPRYMNHADILAQYDAIMVLDDDIEIEGTGINRLFELREEFNLWAIAPSFKQPYVEREEETKRREKEERKRRGRKKRRGGEDALRCVTIV